MAAEVWVYIFCLVDTAAMLFMAVFYARGIFLGGTITEICKLKFISSVRIPAVFVLVICGAEPEIINLSDLECDYINAATCCNRLNKCIIPEIVAHLIMTLLLLSTFSWFLLLVNVPMAAWLIYRSLSKPKGNLGLYDPAEIHNRNALSGFLKESMIKLGYHLVCFFIYLYSMITALVAKESSE